MPCKKRKIILFAFTLVFSLVSELTAQADCWYNTSWSHRIKIRVVRSRVSGSHVDFPAYFNLNSLSATNFFSRVRADGGDIRITRSDGKTELAREIVAINTGASTGEIHFKIPFLSGGEEFYIYYGNPAASDYAINAVFGAENVWTNSYLVVYHMQQNPSTGTLLDSTSNSNDGTPQNMAGEATVTGKVGEAYDFDGVNEYISTAIDGSQFDQITVTTWFDNDLNSTAEHYIYDNSPTNTGYSARLEGGVSKSLIAFTYANTTADIATHGNTLINTWYYLNHTVDGTNVNIYVNGTLTDAEPQNAIGIRNTSDTFEIARHSDNDVGNEFDGTIDELRIATVPRTANWIRTEYNNQNSPSTFWSISSADAQGTQWYGCAWKQRKIIRVVPARVTGTQTDYPTYFDLSNLAATNFFSEVRANGGDIRITQCDGTTELAREIVSIDTVNGRGELHFLIPSMSGGEEFFIYYGNPTANDYAITDTYGAQNVWATNYLGVWHINEDPDTGIAFDATGNSFDGSHINLAGENTVASQIGNAISFDGANESIRVPHSASLLPSNITVSAWIQNIADPAIYDSVLMKTSSGSWVDGYGIFYQANTIRFFVQNWSANVATRAFLPSDRARHLVTGVYNGSAINIYLDAVQGTTGTRTGGYTGNTASLNFAEGSLGNYYYPGIIDEIRLANVARSATWISTEYNNQSNPSTFWDLTVVDDLLEIISFTPPDNGTAATVTANLEILFDQVPAIFNGNMIIRRFRDNSIFQTYDTNGTTFTVSGNSVRLRLTNPLFYNEYYYVELGCGAFGAAIGPIFLGFDDNGTWNFYSGGMQEEIDFFGKNFR